VSFSKRQGKRGDSRSMDSKKKPKIKEATGKRESVPAGSRRGKKVSDQHAGIVKVPCPEKEGIDEEGGGIIQRSRW